MLRFLTKLVGGRAAGGENKVRTRLGMELLEGRLAPSGDLTDAPPTPPTAVEVSILMPALAHARAKANVFPAKSE